MAVTGVSGIRSVAGHRVLASSATPAQAASDAPKDPKIAELPKGRSAFVLAGPETSG
jgi:hypothetical protein